MNSNFFNAFQAEKCFRSKNLIEFNNIYENIQQQQRTTSNIPIPAQLTSSTCSSAASSFSMSSLNTNFSTMSIGANSNNRRNNVDYKKLFVGNLPANTKLNEILQVFRKYGPINEKLSVVKDQNYAFVHFIHENDAKIALKETNDSLFKNRYIRVQFSTSQAHMKKSRTIDETIGLLKEAPEIKPHSFMRPITGGNRCFNQTIIKSPSLDVGTQPQYYSPFRQYQLFEILPSSNMAKSNTFSTFQD